MAPDVAAGPEADQAARPELGDAPPFATWPRIYLIVLGALAVQMILYAALTAAYR
ncbi:MAG TPA: hypothetical protein VGK52_19610 [Polyangia bacterium]|jgi:hypothetical protein